MRSVSPHITKAEPFEARGPKLLAECDAKLAALGPSPPWWRLLARRRWRRERTRILTMDVSIYAEMLRDWYSDERIKELAASPPVWSAMTKAGKKWH